MFLGHGRHYKSCNTPFTSFYVLQLLIKITINRIAVFSFSKGIQVRGQCTWTWSSCHFTCILYNVALVCFYVYYEFLVPSGVRGANADRRRSPGGPTECFRIQLHCGESNTGISHTDFNKSTPNVLTPRDFVQNILDTAGVWIST